MPSKNSNKMQVIKEFEAMLESDDELPVDYVDVPDIPAYKMDNRFEPVQFRWIDSNFSKYYQKTLSQQNAKQSILYSSLSEDHLFSKTENLVPGEKSLILNGVLALQDLYCLKCIESSTSDNLFLWFINFLFYKDLQANYAFLKTCLVSVTQDSFDKNIGLMFVGNKNFTFDFVVA